jgi:hypothetical protein
MYKTLIQLVLLLILILIIFFISNKYFYTEDKINEVKNTNNSLNIEKNNLLNKDLDKKNIDNEIINLAYEKFDTNGNKYLIKAKKGILDSKIQILFI